MEKFSIKLPACHKHLARKFSMWRKRSPLAVRQTTYLLLPYELSVNEKFEKSRAIQYKLINILHDLHVR